MTDPLSQAPVRLLDDPSLAASLRGDLQLAAQPALTYNVEAGLARFESSLAAGASPTTLGASKALMTSRVLGWVLGAGVLVAGSVGAGQLVEHARTPRTHAGVVVQTPSKIAAVERAQEVRAQHGEVVESSSLGAGAARAVPGESAAAARSGELARDASLAPAAEQAGGNSSGSDGVAPLRPVSKSSGAEAADPQPSLADEARQINEARKALKSDPARALALTEAAAKAFPQGAMIQEREGYAILALAALGRSDEARARADEYLARWPNGTLSKRVQAAVGN